jgi:adenylate cyclase
LEDIHSEKLDENAALLAHHWGEAGEALMAAHWHQRAGRWAGLTNPKEAIRHWTRVRALLAELPESLEVQQLGVEACSGTLLLAYHVGISEHEAEQIFSEGRALAERSGSPALLASLLTRYAPVRGMVFGDVEGWVRYGCDSLEVAASAGDPGLEFNASLAAQVSLWAFGRPRQSLEVVERMLATRSLEEGEQLASIWGLSPYLYAMGFRGLTKVYVGELEDGISDIDKTIELARQRGDRQVLKHAHEWRTWAADLKGEREEALTYGQRTVDLAEELESPLHRGLGYFALGQARVLRGEWDDAGSVLKLSRESIRESHTVLYLEPAVLAYMAAAFLGAGDEELARTTARDAVDLAQERRVVIYEMLAMLIRVRVLLATDGISAREEIEAALDTVLTLVKENGARVYEPFAVEQRARLTRLLSSDDAFEHHLREAHRLYTEIGATGHAERLARELGLDSAPVGPSDL